MFRDYYYGRVINSLEKGLSKSRNLAIDSAIGDICLIADDDVEYVKGFDEIILIAFKLSSIKLQVVGYNEHFGLGARFQSVDEYVFLRNASRAKLKVFLKRKEFYHISFLVRVKRLVAIELFMHSEDFVMIILVF